MFTQKLGITKLKANHQWWRGGWFSCKLITFSHDWSLLEICQSRKVTLTFSLQVLPHHTQIVIQRIFVKEEGIFRTKIIFNIWKKIYNLKVLVLSIDWLPNISRRCDDSDCNRSLKCWKEVRKCHYPKPKSDKYRSVSHRFYWLYEDIIHYKLIKNIILILGIISSYNEKDKNIMAIKLW